MFGSVVRRALHAKAALRHLAGARRPPRGFGTEAELDLYAAIFQNDFLHAGYFREIPDDPEDISLRAAKQATRAYAGLIVERIAPGQSVLDIGCGMGGLLGLLRDAGVQAAGLTPNPGHVRHIHRRYPGIPVILCPFERLDTARHRGAFDAAVSAESFHNVSLDTGMRNVREILDPAGKWISLDYYRLREHTYNRSGHLLSEFTAALRRHGFRIIEETDITANTLPTLALAHCWAERIGLPLLDFAVGKFFRRHPLLGYLFRDTFARARARPRLDALDPAVFQRDKRYLLHELSR